MTKVLSEEKYRANLFSLAKEIGVEHDLARVIKKYDDLLAKCTNQAEKQAIAVAGAEEVGFVLSNYPGKMVVGGFLYKGQQIGGTVVGRDDPQDIKKDEGK